MRGCLLLGVVVFAACECGTAGPDDAGADAGFVETDAGTETRLDGGLTLSLASDFGAVTVGTSRDEVGVVRNETPDVALVTVGVDAGAFSIVDGGTLRLEPGDEGRFVVRFAPTRFGPVEDTVAAGNARLTVRGLGVGASLRVPASVEFGTVPIYAGPIVPDERPLLLENVGEGVDAQLTFEVVALQGDERELCVADCIPGVTRLRPGESLRVSVRLSPATPGMRRYEVRVFSNDVFEPLRTITVTADVVSRSTCHFGLGNLDFGVLNEHEVRRLPLAFENLGTEPCELSSIDITPTRPPVLAQPLFALESPAGLPLVVPPGSSTTLVVRAVGQRPPSSNRFTSSLSIAVNSPQFYAVAELQAVLGQACRFVGLSRPLDFGAVTTGCSSPARPLETLNSGCSGTPGAIAYGALGPQFQLSLPPLLPTVRFTPTVVGPVHDVLRVDWTWNLSDTTTTVELHGEGVATAHRTDRFTVASQQKTDVLFVIGDGTSMQAYEARLRARLPPLVPALLQRGVDAHFGVISAHDVVNLGAMRSTPTGQHFVSSSLPSAEATFAGLLTVGANAPMPGCNLPALRSLAFPAIGAQNRGFRRADASLQIVCITDRVDADVALAPQVMELARLGSFTWHVIGPTDPNASCPRSISPSGHTVLPGLTGGARDELCGDWSAALAGVVNGVERRRFTLSSVPDLQQPLEVRLNGVALPSQATWSFDAAANAVVFTPTALPAPGSTVTVEYAAACAP